MQFYNVKSRAKVEIDESELSKKKFVRTTKSGGTQTRYAARANVDGTTLTRFITEADYNRLSVPEEK